MSADVGKKTWMLREGASRTCRPDFEVIFDGLPRPTLVIEPPDFVMIAANEARYRVTNTDEKSVIGQKLFDVFPDNPEDPESTGAENLLASLTRVIETGRTDVMPVQKYDIHGPDGQFEERWWSPVNTPILRSDGSVCYIIHQVDDVTDEIRARQRANRAEAEHVRCLQLADAIPGLVFETDANARNIYVNEQFRDYTGLSLEALLNDGWCHAIHPDDREATVSGWCEALRSGRSYETQCRIRSASGEWRWFVVRGTLLRDSSGSVERAIGICTDVTAQQNQHDFQALLMRELSHRVKNSLSLVSALLHLQSRNLDEASRNALEDASARVQAVATVHDQLWRQSDVRQIDLEPFLTNLGAALAKSAPQIQTMVLVEPAYISADQAVPVGLLVNELVTNAYKYAYPGGEGGRVEVRGSRTGEGRYEIAVCDQGRGLPYGFDINRSGASLGMRIVSTLANQLNARVVAGSAEPGARFAFDFPLG